MLKLYSYIINIEKNIIKTKINKLITKGTTEQLTSSVQEQQYESKYGER